MGLLDYEAHPFRSLITAFAAWKALLLAIAVGAAVGPDYDTSTSVFFEVLHGSNATAVPMLAARLTRWDALYFMHTARNGYVYEQEWAFGMGLPGFIRRVGRLLEALGMRPTATPAWEPLVGIALAHVSHLVAVLALYQLAVVLSGGRKLAFVAALLHVLSPAGIFLSAPYNESPFAGLSFVGNLVFAIGIKKGPDSPWRNLSIVLAGAMFGLASLFRSNGLFSGILFAVEVLKVLAAFAKTPSIGRLLRFVAPIVGGLLVATGTVGPQYIAWARYCSAPSPESTLRPWCSRLLPSIYTFVQEEYWNVGFLRYWTPNQIPLFLLAAPMLIILIKSGTEVIRRPSVGLRRMVARMDQQDRLFVQTLAVSQTLIAVLAVTNYHVQVITRIASGYPVWYWWVASCLLDKSKRGWGYGISMFIVMYAVIQGALFASFLPPA